VHSLSDYLSTLSQSGWNAVSAVLFLGGSLAWIAITWPKAVAALSSGRCTISIDKQTVRFYGEAVERENIAAVDVVRRPFDFQFRLRRKDGSAMSKSITLLAPSPQVILAALRDEAV
jgi:hypothetical protein